MTIKAMYTIKGTWYQEKFESNENLIDASVKIIAKIRENTPNAENIQTEVENHFQFCHIG